MTNADFKQARITLALTQSQLAEQLGITERQVRRLETDDTIQRQTALAIKYLLTRT